MDHLSVSNGKWKLESTVSLGGLEQDRWASQTLSVVFRWAWLGAWTGVWSSLSSSYWDETGWELRLWRHCQPRGHQENGPTLAGAVWKSKTLLPTLMVELNYIQTSTISESWSNPPICFPKAMGWRNRGVRTGHEAPGNGLHRMPSDIQMLWSRFECIPSGLLWCPSSGKEQRPCFWWMRFSAPQKWRKQTVESLWLNTLHIFLFEEQSIVQTQPGLHEKSKSVSQRTLGVQLTSGTETWIFAMFKIGASKREGQSAVIRVDALVGLPKFG